MNKCLPRFRNMINTVLCVWLFCAPAWGLTPETDHAINDASSTSAVTAAEFENTERVIDANQPINDAKIQSRVLGILTTAEQYTDLSVESRQGLVFLSGEVTQERFVAWAADIAKNVEGVVAVINNITVAETSVLDMDPVRGDDALVVCQFACASYDCDWLSGAFCMLCVGSATNQCTDEAFCSSGSKPAGSSCITSCDYAVYYSVWFLLFLAYCGAHSSGGSYY